LKQKTEKNGIGEGFTHLNASAQNISRLTNVISSRSRRGTTEHGKVWSTYDPSRSTNNIDDVDNNKIFSICLQDY
jgi:hypothetical protein